MCYSVLAIACNKCQHITDCIEIVPTISMLVNYARILKFKVTYQHRTALFYLQ